MAKWKKDSSGNWKKSSSSSKKTYTVIDGKKVEKSTIDIPKVGTVSDTWNKDTVTLEEAKNQSSEASSYLQQQEQAEKAAQGTVETVDVGSAGISDSWNKDTVSLSEAANQTSQAEQYLAAKDTQTQEYQASIQAAAEANKADAMRNGLVGNNTSMYEDITGKYVPSVVNPEYAATYLANKEAEKVQAAKRAIAETQTMQLINSFGRVNLQEDQPPTRSERLANFLVGTANKVESSAIVQKVENTVSSVVNSDAASKVINAENTILAAIGMPTITQASDAAKGVVSSLSEAASYGFSGGKSGSIETTDKGYYTASIARKGQEYAEKISSKGGELVSKAVDLAAGKDGVIQVPSMLGTGQTMDIPSQAANDFLTGATVDMASFLVSGASGVPLAAEVAVRDPTEFGRALVSGTGLIIGSTAKMAVDEPVKFAGNIVGGLVVGKVGGDVAGSVKVGKAEVVKQTGAGAKPTYEPINYGAQLSVADNPILSFSKESGLKLGKGVAAPLEAIDPKVPVTAFTKTQTANFIATLEKHGIEPEYFKAGHNIASSVNRTPTPVKSPSAFEITSEHIPENVKPVIKKVLQDYSGDVEVYGSVAQKAQMGEYMTRMPADLEVMVPYQYAMTTKLAREMGKKGQSYQIKGIGKNSVSDAKPKIMFGGDKGIEIFSSLEDAGAGYHPNSPVAYGLKEFDAIQVDRINLMDLREQGARKLGGGLTLQKSPLKTSIEPVHIGRIKDVSDLVEIGVGHAIEKNPRIAADVLKFNKLAREKYGTMMDNSKLSKFMESEGRMPTKGELGNLLSNTETKASRELLFKKIKEPESMKGSSAAGKIGKAGKVGSLAGLSSSAKTGKAGKKSSDVYSMPIGVDLPGPSYPFPSVPNTRGRRSKTPYPGSPRKVTPPSTPSIPTMPGTTPPSTPPSMPVYPPGWTPGGGVTLPPPPEMPVIPTSKPGRKGTTVLPGSTKKSSKQKKQKAKATMTPGELHNKYRNPLSIKFKL